MKYALAFLVLFLAVTPAFAQNYFTIGADDGEGFLISPAQVEEGPDGNIYAYDRKDGFIKVYSSKGDYLRKIGGPGEGPGYLKRTDGATIGFTKDGKLFFTQFFRGHRWITLMNLDGSFHKVWTPKMKENMLGVSQASPLSGGGFLVGFSFIGTSQKQGPYYLHKAHHGVFLLNPKGEIVSKIIETGYFNRISYMPRGADLGLPYVPHFMWSCFGKDAVISSNGTGQALKVLGFNGRLVKEIKMPLPPSPPVTSKDLDDWRKGEEERFSYSPGNKRWFEQFGRVIDKYKTSVYKHKPYITGLRVTPAGNILLTRTMEGEETNMFWLIDASGKTLVQIALDAYRPAITKGFIFFKKMDEEGDEVVCCFTRKGSETDDLTALEKALNQ